MDKKNFRSGDMPVIMGEHLLGLKYCKYDCGISQALEDN